MIKHVPLPPMSPRLRRRMRAALKVLGCSYAEAIEGLDPLLPPAQHIMLIEAWNALPPENKREWDKSASIENRRLARIAKEQARRAAAN
jgi:hypothetical protein